MSYLLSITLDGLPPTVNHLYRTGGRHRYKTAEGAAYQEATAAELRFQEEKRLRLFAEEEFGNAKLEAEKLRDEYDRKKRFYWEEDEADE